MRLGKSHLHCPANLPETTLSEQRRGASNGESIADTYAERTASDGQVKIRHASADCTTAEPCNPHHNCLCGSLTKNFSVPAIVL